MNRHTLIWTLLVGILATASFRVGRAEDKPKGPGEERGVISPDLDRCVLDVGRRELKPAKPASVFRPGYSVGALRVVVDEAGASAFQEGEERPRWTVKAPAGTRLAWLTADDKTAYFAGYMTDAKAREYRPEAPARVRRLELAGGKWLDDLPVGGSTGPKETEAAEGVLVGNGLVAVLTVVSADDSDREKAGRAGSYRVTHASRRARSSRSGQRHFLRPLACPVRGCFSWLPPARQTNYGPT
jgi:hypothetical protein